MAGPQVLRNIHRWTAPFTGLYLLVFAVTGMVYRILADQYDYDNNHVHYFLEIHNAEIYAGRFSALIYIVVAMILITIQVLTGLTMVERWWGLYPRKAVKEGPGIFYDARSLHHFLASFLWAFLLMKTYSNGVFIIMEHGFQVEGVSLGDFANYHDGRIPGKARDYFPFYYAMVLGSLTIILSLAGFVMKVKPKKNKGGAEEYFIAKDYDWEAYHAYGTVDAYVEADPRRTRSDAWLEMGGKRKRQAAVPAAVPE